MGASIHDAPSSLICTMQIRFILLIISLFSSCQSEPQWTEEMIKTALEKAEVPWNEGQKMYADTLGNLINICTRERDLNGDGKTELLLETSGSYYLWGSAECACFIINQEGENLIEVIGGELSVFASKTNGYRDIGIDGKRGMRNYVWGENDYVITD